jgi:hypothetical protein
MYKSTIKKYKATRPKQEKERKKLAIYISSKAENLSRLLDFDPHQTKFFSELCLTNIEINMAIVKDHSISCRPNDPTCSNEDLSEKWPAKGCSSFNNHV